ncbi:MAG: hypothetical protein FIB07_17045 [Candidatus Methanoperedens sp.]|nr:hypothetical protein [Candidatus Methanoperedens sp.]
MTNTATLPNKDISHSEIDVYQRIISRWDIWSKQDTKPNEKGKYGYEKRISPLTEELLRKSIAEDTCTIGTYCINPRDQTVKNPTIDIDAHYGENHVREKARAVYQTLVECGAHPYIEATAGKIDDGARVGILCSPWKAEYTREFLLLVLKFNGLMELEVFPSQDQVGAKNPGGLVRLPFQFHNRTKTRSEIVDPLTLETLPREKGIEFMMTLPETNMQIVKFPGEDSVLNLWGDKPNNNSDFNHRSRLYYDDIPKVGNFDELLGSLRYCFQENYKLHTETTDGSGWAWMTYAACEILANGGSSEHVHQYFSVQNQYKRSTTAKNLIPIKRKGLIPPRCTTIQEKCSKYVDELCPNCPIWKEKKLHEDLEKTVDKTQGKENRKKSQWEIENEKNNEAGKILKQFKQVAGKIDDILSGDTDLLLTTPFNTGKTWASITYAKKVIPKERLNFIVHSTEVRQQVVQRLKKCEMPFLDNPSSLEICPRVEELVKEGLDVKKMRYVDRLICKNCESKGAINVRDLSGLLKQEYLEDFSAGGFYGDQILFNKIGEDWDVCPRWVYTALLLAIGQNDIAKKSKKAIYLTEPLVLVTTYQKVNSHLFSPDSPLIPALGAHVNIIDQIDFIDMDVPKTDILRYKSGSANKITRLSVEEAIKILDISVAPENISSLEEELNVIIKIAYEEGGSYLTMKEIGCISLLNRWVYLEKRVGDGTFRKIYHLDRPGIFTYDYMSDRPLKFVFNDLILEKHNAALYQDLLKHIKETTVISPHPRDGIIYGPLKFSKILKEKSYASHILGMTSTPTNLEMVNGSWRKQFEGNGLNWISNLYGRSIGQGIAGGSLISSDHRLIAARKVDGDEYINDGKVRGNTGTKEDNRNASIPRYQYPMGFLDHLSYMIQLCNGNVAEGIEIAYQQVVAGAVTRPQDGKPAKVSVPQFKLLKDLGFPIKELEKDSQRIFQRLVPELKRRGYIYSSDTRVSKEDLNYLVSEGYLIQDGKKYLPSNSISSRVEGSEKA